MRRISASQWDREVGTVWREGRKSSTAMRFNYAASAHFDRLAEEAARHGREPLSAENRWAIIEHLARAATRREKAFSERPAIWLGGVNHAG